MSRKWKPGDVALLPDGKRAVVADQCLVYGRGDFSNALFGSRTASLARPLVVIDPEDLAEVERIIPPNSPRDKVSLRWMQDHLRSLVAPPKPAEPQGLGAVVEDAEGYVWVRFKTAGVRPWRQNYPGDDEAIAVPREFYRAVAAVRVLSEGVTP